MATSLEQVQAFLDEFDLNYRVDEERSAILIGFNLDPDETTYRDRDGDAHVRLVIRLMEDGDFLQVFAPWAWTANGCPHKAAVFEAIATIQARYKMLRFDYDPADGEIRPNVELPLEDAEPTSRQFHRTIHAAMHGIQRFDGVIRHALATGEVSFASVEDDEHDGATSSELARLERLAAEAGGVEALERLACGCIDGDLDREPGEEPRVEDGSVSGRPGEHPEDASPAVAEPPPKPVIRRIWERLFGPDEPESGTGRRAG